MTKVSNEDFTVSIDFERVFARWKGFTNAYMWIISIYYFNILDFRVSAIPHGPSAKFLVENGKCVEGL